LLLEPCKIRLSGRLEQGTIAAELGVLVAEHRGVVDHHDPAQCRESIGERQELVEVFLIFGDEQRGAAVAHLVLEFRCRRGRVDAVDDGAERLRRKVADHPFLAGVAHDRHPVAAAKSERGKRACRARD
jgi:hypothetical protein